MRQAGWVFIVGTTLCLAGCGMKGPLFLPDKNASVVTRPGSSNTTTAPPPLSSPAPVAPAPGDTAPGTPEQAPPPPPRDESKDDSQSSGSTPKS